MTFGYCDAYQIPKSFEKKTHALIKDEINIIKKNLLQEYDSDYASFYLPEDTRKLNEILTFAKAYAHYDTLVVVGIGGSNLGTKAVFEAIHGRQYQFKKGTKIKKVLFSDTVDSFEMKQILTILQEDLKQGHKILINAISKSGGTTETIANTQILFEFFKKHKVDVTQHMVITTNKDSPFQKFAEKNAIPHLEIPKLVGGRYSVFSSVGIFPLAVLGLDVKKLIEGAQHMSAQCLALQDNPALLSAKQLAYALDQGIIISETLIFESKLESLGKWYRQLMGESLGKQYTKQNKETWNGMTPTVAIGSTDLHSLAQLYLGGPWDKYLTLVLPENVSRLQLGNKKDFDKLVPHIQKKYLQDIMSAIIEGMKGALLKQGRPFNMVQLHTDDLYDIGAFMQWKMYEIVFLARIMNVNPFDQPNVEEYKLITKEVLKK